MEILSILWAVFMIADVFAYVETKYTERASDWRYKLPGGGFVALYKFGRDRD